MCPTFRPHITKTSGGLEPFASHVVTQGASRACESNLSPFVCAAYAWHRGFDRTSMAVRHTLDTLKPATHIHVLQACMCYGIFTALVTST